MTKVYAQEKKQRYSKAKNHSNVLNVIPWNRVMTKVYAQEKKQRYSKAKNHSEVLKRLRLTRFGWERRRARLRGKAKRKRSSASKKKSRTIEFLHRSDFAMIQRASWSYRLRRMDFPQDPNINLRAAREEIGHRFG